MQISFPFFYKQNGKSVFPHQALAEGVPTSITVLGGLKGYDWEPGVELGMTMQADFSYVRCDLPEGKGCPAPFTILEPYPDPTIEVPGVLNAIQLDTSLAAPGRVLIKVTADPDRRLVRPDPQPLNNSASMEMEVGGSKLKLAVKPLDGTPIEEEVAVRPTVQVLPSVKACGKLPDRSELARLEIRCVDEAKNLNQPGCTYRVRLEEGTFAGGHDRGHEEKRPLGAVLPKGEVESWGNLPLDGTTVQFQSPDVSGEVDLWVEGRGPTGIPLAPVRVRYQVRTPGFKQLSVQNLEFKVASHPDGTYGTDAMQQKLEKMSQTFTSYAEAEGIQSIPTLRSEGVSIPWGGVFDVDGDWDTPHCGHRDGVTMDLSLSVFNSYPVVTAETLKTALSKAVTKAGFAFTYAPESPRPKGQPQPDHWHIRLK